LKLISAGKKLLFSGNGWTGKNKKALIEMSALVITLWFYC